MKIDLYKQKRIYKAKDGTEKETTDLIAVVPYGKETIEVRIAPAFAKDPVSWRLLYGCAEQKQ